LHGPLEHFQKNCSHAAGELKRAAFLGFGFVSAQSQGFTNLLHHQNLAKTQKSSLRIGYIFSSNALIRRFKHGNIIFSKQKTRRIE
jgi:hypothetical protein